MIWSQPALVVKNVEPKRWQREELTHRTICMTSLIIQRLISLALGPLEAEAINFIFFSPIISIFGNSGRNEQKRCMYRKLSCGYSRLITSTTMRDPMRDSMRPLCLAYDLQQRPQRIFSKHLGFTIQFHWWIKYV